MPRTRFIRNGWRLVEKLTGYYAEKGRESVRICSTRTDPGDRFRLFYEFADGRDA